MGKGFQCKQFFVGHDHCAMKVSTDALVLGSWISTDNASKALDIGCGSGILSLMLRQRMNEASEITALDTDSGAVRQTRLNIANSPWPNTVNIVHCPLARFQATDTFDLIVCNPPYFSNAGVGQHAHLKQSDERQNARHDNALPPIELFSWVAQYLSETGRFYCLYPASRLVEITDVAATVNLHLSAALKLHHSATKSAHAVALKFERGQAPAQFHTGIPTSLFIRNDDNQYTDAYKSLCHAFYLNF